MDAPPAYCADNSTNFPAIYSTDNIEECRRYVSVNEIDCVEASVPYHKIFNKYIKSNRPFILSHEATRDWQSRKDWVQEDGLPNLDFLKQAFGDASAPVANCGLREYCAHPKTDMTVADYVDYWRDYQQQGYPSTKPCLYLKDWHFNRAFPHYPAYTTPTYFLSDWLNEFWDSRADGEDDYRFVYMGPKGSWTPFHADVFRSFSWSANICGLKKWIFYPPGTEGKVTDRLGNVALDVTSPDLQDAEKYPHYHSNIPSLEAIQKPGEIIFVPTGWFHQVINLEDCISINHNWLNGCNVDLCWDFLKTSLSDVEKEIADCREMEGWHKQCQLILKSTSGIEYMEFYNFLRIIAETRFRVLQILTNKENLNRTMSADHRTDMCDSDRCDSDRCDSVHHECTCHSGQSLDTDINRQTHDMSDSDIPINEDLETLNIYERKRDKQTDTEAKCSCCFADNLHKLPEDIFPRGLRARVVQDYRHVLTLNHAVFDLRRIQTVVRDMLDTAQFSLLLSETEQVDTQKLLEKISSFL